MLKYMLLIGFLVGPNLLSDQVIKLTLTHLKHLEGFRSTPYRDGKGWAYGYGQRTTSRYATITKVQAEAQLLKEIANLRYRMAKHISVNLTIDQEVALICFVYNVGLGAFERSTLLRELNASRYTKIPSELNRWVYSAGKPILINRRAYEISLWNGNHPGSV